MSERPLPYQLYFVRRKSLPNFSPVDRKFRLAKALEANAAFAPEYSEPYLSPFVFLDEG
jgi:hypothetical protein